MNFGGGRDSLEPGSDKKPKGLIYTFRADGEARTCSLNPENGHWRSLLRGEVSRRG